MEDTFLQFSVFQWLVSQVLETRQARGEVIRRYATFQYKQQFSNAGKEDAEESLSRQKLEENYLPKRKFRQKVKNSKTNITMWNIIELKAI